MHQMDWKISHNMKSWKRKIQKMFSCKRDTKTSRVDSGSNMMEKRTERMASQHRRLPTVPRAPGPNSSAVTIYRNAGDSTSENHQTTYRSDELNERIPNLMKQKQKSGEKVHEFGESLTFKRHSGMNSGTTDLFNKGKIGIENAEGDTTRKTCADLDDDKMSLPEILISLAENDDQCVRRNEPKQVFVCGHFENDLWQRLLVDLCREFSIRCISPSDYPECNRWLSSTDVFLFLIDEVSVRASPYKDQLGMAIMLDLNIVYVRDLGFELNAGEENRKHLSNETLKGDNKVGLLNPKSIEPNNFPHQKLPVELHTDSTASLHENFSKSKSRETYGRREVDTSKILETEYGTALIYHDLYHSKCLERIIWTIHNHGPNFRHGAKSCALSDNSSTSGSMPLAYSRHSLNTPAFSMYSSISTDSALGDMYQRMTPEPNALGAEDHLPLDRSKSLDDISFPSGLSSPTETIYIVSPEIPSEKPRVFHWPEDIKKESIENSPSIDSFGFQDIDLSKQINEIDFFEDYLSD